PGAGCRRAQSSPTPSTARRARGLKYFAIRSNSPTAIGPLWPKLGTQFPHTPRRPVPAARNLQSSPRLHRECFMSTQEEKRAELRKAALEYHEFPTPGKVSIAATKQLINQRDLALAYSPGVAAACEEIAADPVNAFRYTARGNLVAVVTNGTAVLGLG